MQMGYGHDFTGGMLDPLILDLLPNRRMKIISTESKMKSTLQPDQLFESKTGQKSGNKG